MVDVAPANEGVTALYRRFRPGRFAEMRGQEHIVRALQGAVAHDRVVHAYLFSGPRGTGKTTTARILAKALNCENPVDGDACNRCDSCVAITRGTSLDVVELDAASNNGVDDIREITSGAWHGSSGRWKVYIIDEVHMLSNAAEAAFLKTLEEPPAHVVFVLATTDPHKVKSTIRSRTQHLEFRLISSDTLNNLLHEIRDAAGLSVDEETIATAVRMGHGSARDALSALDQVLATGSIGDAAPPFDTLLSALATSDSVVAISALSDLTRLGWDPEQLGEALAGELRQIFLLLVAPDVSDALDLDRERLSTWGQDLGLPRTVRALETVGRTLREMKNSPVPIVMLEVALVRLTRADLDDSVSALDERLSRVERSIAQGALSTPAPSVPSSRPIGALNRTTAPGAKPVAPVKNERALKAEVVASDVTPVEPEPEPEPEPAAPTTAASEGIAQLSLDEFTQRFSTKVVPRLARSAQVFLSTSRVQSLNGNLVTIALPSEPLRSAADKIQSGLRSALEHEFQSPVQISWTVDTSIDTRAPQATNEPSSAPRVDEIDDLSDREIAEAESVDSPSIASLLITEAFPGAEELS
jgi:DNA polymerase-3 subunit gamma/tau